MPKQTTLEPEMGVRGLDNLVVRIERGKSHLFESSDPDRLIVTNTETGDFFYKIPFGKGERISGVFPWNGGKVGFANKSGLIEVQAAYGGSVLYQLTEGNEVDQG